VKLPGRTPDRRQPSRGLGAFRALKGVVADRLPGGGLAPREVVRRSRMPRGRCHPASRPETSRHGKPVPATEAADAAVKGQRQLERVYRKAASALLGSTTCRR
jgi:hypothetical protein